MKVDNRPIPILVILLWLLGFPAVVEAQQPMQYTGPLQVLDYLGDATFSYDLVNNDTILNGPFRMERTDLKALLEGEDTSLFIRGNFKNDYPEGEWVFRFGEFQSDLESQVVDYQYRVKVNGIQHEASGNLINGIPDGSWEYSVRAIRDSEIDTTRFLSSVQFKGGKPQKSFRISNKAFTLVGRTINGGLAHDQWSIFPNDGLGALENWTFENGILRQIEREINGERKQLQLYSRPFEAGKTIALGEGFFKLVRIKNNTEPEVYELPVGLPDLLRENAAYYQKLNQFLNALGTADLKPGFQVKVPYFPLEATEHDALDTITAKVLQAKEITESLLNDTHLNILTLTDKRAALLQQLISKLSTSYLVPLERFTGYFEEDLLEYLPRTELVNYIWPNGFPDTAITLDPEEAGGDSVIYKGPGADNYVFRTGDLNTVLQMAQYASGWLRNIEEELSEKLSSEKRQQEYTNLEAQLILKNKEINRLVDSLSQNNREDVIQTLQKIKAFGSQQLSAYASLKESKEKLDLGRKLKSCFTELQSLVMTIGVLVQKEEAIGKRYQDAVWNPFLFVIMDEEVKKRITTAYRKKVVPYLLDQVNNKLSCDNATKFIQLFEQLDKRMVEMRDENTAKLERKLRREQDPEAILELFQIQSNTGE